jgi:2-amino-4-hydroxy-6-hydroxymethyldihydropteridine diphosphokinase
MKQALKATQDKLSCAWITCYIALGSNLDDPAKQISQALVNLAALPQSKLIKTALWYSSHAIGPGVQNDYINTVVQLDTYLSAHALLQELQQIENLQGRVRSLPNVARTLDLDILLYGNQVINTTDLTIPHPHLTLRNFVVYPLHYLVPDLQLPSHYNYEGKYVQGNIKQLFLSCTGEGISLYINQQQL